MIRASPWACRGRIRWAASVVPPGVIAGAVTMAGVTGKKVGMKAVPGLMAIPAVALLMIALTFFGGMRALRAAGRPDNGRLESDDTG